MLLSDFTFDDHGVAGWPVSKKHYVEVTKKVDLNSEAFTFDIVLTEKLPGCAATDVSLWPDLDPVAAQCVIWELFEGRVTPGVTREEA